jgi:hypothetical protein
MPKYHYQCLYCGDSELSLAGLDDHMALCFRCGHLMLRLDNNFFWDLCDKDNFQFATEENVPPGPPTKDSPVCG